MKTIKLKLAEIENIQYELVGKDKFKGLLSQKVNLIIKKKLLNLLEEITPHINQIRTLNNDLITELGIEQDGNHIIPVLLDDAPNPAYITYQEKYIELMSAEEDIKADDFSIEDFNIDTDEVYPIFLTKICK